MRVEAPPSPARVLLERVTAMREPGIPIAVASDADSYADRGLVLLGICTDAACCVMTIERTEYDAEKILKTLGIDRDMVFAAPPDAMKRATGAMKGKK